ncbi:hypothetical protein BC936DRAFT_145298 [Jimgerdemannia flammicorona]|uniref:Uncharacterized protein n=1 Tax=Jimgerdemannia flammicorona TaxID=994334 RepID=A0A433DAB5_9FUNG|nr:hypothetical protein BC936DRAFT_145298 [Jimgerdemannia flammicorona]
MRSLTELPPILLFQFLLYLTLIISPVTSQYDGNQPQRWDLVSDRHHGQTYRPYTPESTTNTKRSQAFTPNYEIQLHDTRYTISRIGEGGTRGKPHNGNDYDYDHHGLGSYNLVADQTSSTKGRPTATAGSSFYQPRARQNTTDSKVYINITISLMCDYGIENTDFCIQKVADAIASAAMYLNSVVNLMTPIKVCATYCSFCTNGCSNNTLGWAAPGSQWTLPNLANVDPNYLYPQSLAKQLVPFNISMNWNECDIIAEFNHDAYMAGIKNAPIVTSDVTNTTNTTSVNLIPSGGLFWFSSDPQIRSDQVDMKYLILHELIHGFGFISSWGAYFLSSGSPYNDFLGSVLSTQQLQLLTPSPMVTTDVNGITYMSGFLPSMIFDKFLIGIDPSNPSSPPQSLGTLGEQIQSLCSPNQGSFVLDFVKKLLNTPSAADAARQLWRIVNANQTLFFQFPTDQPSPYVSYSNLTMYTTSNTTLSTSEQSVTNFRPGVSISHVDSQYVTTTEFLLRYTPPLGLTLDDISRQTQQNSQTISYTVMVNGTLETKQYDSPIGPGILHVLESMGYSTVLMPRQYPAQPSSDKMWEPKRSSVCLPQTKSEATRGSWTRGWALAYWMTLVGGWTLQLA